MRFFALQNIGKLKKEFILQKDEKEILTTTHHPIAFVVELIRPTIVMVPLGAGIVYAFFFMDNGPLQFALGIALIILIVSIFLVLARAFIAWRLNALVVTTEKVIVIHQKFFFYQKVDPIHLDNIVSTKAESQFFGIWRCGIVHFSLQERNDAGSTRHVYLPYIPKPEVIASAVEQAITLYKEKNVSESVLEQQPKVQEVRDKVNEHLPNAAEVTPGPPPVPPHMIPEKPKEKVNANA